MSDRDRKVLQKILKEISFFEKDVNIAFDEFINNEILKRATAMTLINIGELARLLSDECKKSMPDIPFDAIIATRNVAAHGYNELRFDNIWQTIQIHIPEFKKKISGVLKG